MKEDDAPILIFRLGSLGDTIVALPCFHAIEKCFPSQERILVTNKPVSQKAPSISSILKPTGLVHEAIEFESPLSFRRAFSLHRKLKKTNASSLVYLGPRPSRAAFARDMLFFRAAGIKKIWGGSIFRALEAKTLETGEIEPEVHFLSRSIPELGEINLSEAENWSLRLTREERGRGEVICQPLGNRYICVSIGGKVTKNHWDQRNWHDVLRYLTQRDPTLGLLLVGSSDERGLCEDLMQNWLGPVANAAGELSPREAAAAMGKALAFLGHDSGPMHLAANVGVKCVALFGDNNPPRKWHPFGEGHQIIHRMEGVNSITVDEVLERVGILLNENENGCC